MRTCSLTCVGCSVTRKENKERRGWEAIGRRSRDGTANNQQYQEYRKVKWSKVYVDLYSASTRMPLMRSAMDHTVFTVNCEQHHICINYQSQSIIALWPVLIKPIHGRKARLSWPEWLVGLRQISRTGSWTPIRSRIPVLTGPGVE